MTAPLPVSLPYGIRDVKLTPYEDALGTILGTESVDLPFMQTFSFSEAEEFQELRGDDKLVTTHGQGAKVDWSLEAGGISLKAWKVMSGASLTETGTAPNRQVRIRKKGTDVRPYFRVEGQAISDSGGDMRVVVFRCRVSGELQGEFSDGEFFVTNAGGEGLPLLDDANDLLYDLIQNEQKTTISLTPEPNPIPAPSGLTVGAVASTTVALSWDEVANADSYVVERSVSPYSTWTAVASGAGGEPTTNSTSVTGLTASTGYKFRVVTVVGSDESEPSLPTGVVTTTA